MRAHCVAALLFASVALEACKDNATPSASPSSSSAPPRGASILASAPYRDIEGRFEVTMPTAPKVERHVTKLGFPFTQITSEADGATYHLMWGEFPRGIPVNVAGAFDGAQNDICKQDALTVTTQRDFTFVDKFPARDVTASATAAAPWKDMLRFVYVAPRVYSIFVRGVHDEARAQAFLDSFHVLDAKLSDPFDSSGSDPAAPPTPWISGTLGPAAASFPAAPKETTSKQAGPAGPTDVRTLRATHGNVDMGIELFVIPKPGPETKLPIQTRLEHARDTFKEGLGTKEVTLDEAATRGGQPARRVKLALTDHHGSVELLFVFPKPDTLVVAMVAFAAEPSEADLAESARFFDSFELIPPH